MKGPTKQELATTFKVLSWMTANLRTNQEIANDELTSKERKEMFNKRKSVLDAMEITLELKVELQKR